MSTTAKAVRSGGCKGQSQTALSGLLQGKMGELCLKWEFLR